MLEVSSVFLALLSNRLPVVLGSVRVRSPRSTRSYEFKRSTSKRLKGGTYVHKSIYYLQRPAVPCTPRAPDLGHRAPPTRGDRFLYHAFPPACPGVYSPRIHTHPLLSSLSPRPYRF